MQSVTNFNTILALPHRYEIKVEVWDSQWQGLIPIATIPSKHIISLQTSQSLFDSDCFAIGCCPSGEMYFEFYPKDENDDDVTIPKSAKYKIYVRIVQIDSSPLFASDWFQKGVFITDTKEINEIDGSLKVHGYDYLFQINTLSKIAVPSGSTYYPMSCSNVVTRIAQALHLQLDSRTASRITASKTFTKAECTTYFQSPKELLSSIGVLSGVNFCVSDNNKLLAVSATSPANTQPRIQIGTNSTDLSYSTERTYTGVVLINADKDEYSSGTDGQEIVVSVLWGTQTEADAVMQILSSFTYRPYLAQDIPLNPTAELGDKVLVSGVENELYSQTIKFDNLIMYDAEAPHEDINISEYPIKFGGLGLPIRGSVGNKIGIKSIGRQGIWTYELWTNGMVTAHASYEFNCSTAASYGSFYISRAQQFNLPLDVFGSEPMCQMSISKTGNHDAFLVTQRDISTTETPAFSVVSSSSWTDYVTVDFYLVGEA